MAYGLGDTAESKLSKECTHLLANELKEIHYKLRLACVLLSKLWVLGCNANRACIEVTDAHHDASANN